MEKQAKSTSWVRLMIEIISGGPLFRKIVKNNIIFAIFLTLIGLLYIRNSHFAAQQADKAQKLQRELKELKAEYLTLSAELSRLKRQSMVMQRVDSLGLKPLRQPPYYLIVEKKDE
ncbi:MAG: FtsL-like putative cell division protein [Bacteroidia bacterium]|nr:FtsL-like putative cell division protein [Bacteroidia bacterium]MDW8157670.1 FtsL-like putative cell division protein [Bacteroidia bacterium]